MHAAADPQASGDDFGTRQPAMVQPSVAAADVFALDGARMGQMSGRKRQGRDGPSDSAAWQGRPVAMPSCACRGGAKP
ncbi:MAG: hypothetical protein AAGD12_04960, partial [Pseudomonadota bacterium]